MNNFLDNLSDVTEKIKKQDIICRVKLYHPDSSRFKDMLIEDQLPYENNGENNEENKTQENKSANQNKSNEINKNDSEHHRLQRVLLDILYEQRGSGKIFNVGVIIHLF